jgi:hypothetical protein
MEQIKNLLNQVAIISRKNAEILDATGGRFNIFRVCGVNHYENIHSAIIAEFLNPTGTHGLKSKLLKCFIETLGDDFKIHDFNCEKARVRTECSTEDGRIDILIEDDKDKAIIIENKIYANDQPEQLKRYDRYAAKKYKNGYQILYLTLYGDNASEQSSEGVSDYLPISYKENIINWLEKCAAIVFRYPIVRETIIQYINHLKQLTNQDMDTKNKEEIVEIISKPENIRTAQAIYLNYTAIFDDIIKKHFSPEMEKFARQKGLEYHHEKSVESAVRFDIKNPCWQEKCWIEFAFDSSRGYHYGLCNNPKRYKMSDENSKKIHDKLNGEKTDSDWWAFLSGITNLTIDDWVNNIINSDNFLNDCKEKIEKLLAAMEGIEL